MRSRTGARPPPSPDPLAPFDDALRTRFPSRDELLAEARAQTQRRQRRRLGVPAAAAVAVAIAAGAVALDPAWRTDELRTGIGPPVPHRLADGSRVTLNTASAVRVEHRVRTRRVVLVAGEAAFDVRHAMRPFIVAAGDVRVHDIGTSFSVRRHADAVEVAVIEGAVEVHQPGRGPRRLVAGQGVRAVAHGPARPVHRVDPEAAAAWRDGRIVFDGTPLADVVAEVGRYRRGAVVFEDPAAGRLRLSGVHDLHALDELLDSLPEALPVTVRRDADGRVHIASKR